METRIYKVVNDPEKGFSINETEEINYSSNKSGKKIYNIWYDSYEGGEAWEGDWDMVDEDYFQNFRNKKVTEIPKYGNWNSFESALDWIKENFGEVKLIGKQTFEYYD